MKLFFSKAFILLFSVFALVSCMGSDDEDEDVTYSSWGVAYEIEEMDYDYKVLLDNGTVLIPESETSDFDVETMDRVKVYFQLKPGFDVGLDSINVNVDYMFIFDIKDIVRQDTIEGSELLGTDPIAVYDATVWQSNNLLNIPYAVDVSTGYDKIHSVDLVYFPDSVATEDGGVYMELRHNANNDAEDMVIDGFYSFDMESIAPFQNVSDSVPYTIIINPGAFSTAVSRLEGYYYAPSLLN